MSTHNLSELLQKRLYHIEELARYSKRQLEIIQSADVTLLLELLARKQHCMHEITACERKLDPFRNEKPEQRKWASEEERLKADSMINYSKELINYVKELDAQSEQSLIQLKDRTQKQMKQLETGSVAAGAYAKQQIKTPAKKSTAIYS